MAKTKIFAEVEKSTREMFTRVKALGFPMQDGFNAPSNNMFMRNTAIAVNKCEAWVDASRIAVYVGVKSEFRGVFDELAKNNDNVTKSQRNCGKDKDGTTQSCYDIYGDTAETVIALFESTLSSVINARQDTEKPESKKASRAKKAEKTA